MKTVFAGIAVLLSSCSLVWGGSLNPPAGPTAGTMKALDQIEPRTAVQSLAGSAAAMYVISQPGSYYLTAGITVTELKHAISIETSNVTLDLSGFKITGAYDSPDMNEIPAYDGIHINPGYKNILLRNGIIEGQRKTRRAGIPPDYVWFYTKPFSRAIAADWDIVSVPRVMSQSITVENMTVQGSLTYGIYLKGKNHFVTRCNVINNEGPGIHAGFPSTVKDNHQSSNGDNMLPVESGTFAYQNAGSDINWVNLPDFYMAKYETTNTQYCDFLNEADGKGQYYSSAMEITRSGTAGQYTYAVDSGKDANPIRRTSACHAEAYAKWKSRTTGQNYRLPTEQEWEKAAGWDPVEEKLYTYGFHRDTIDTTWCNYNYAYGDVALPVGSFNGTGGKNNAQSYYGCYDMSGNVLEWTSSSPSSDIRLRVLRGGGWINSATYCAVTLAALNYTPSTSYNWVGFRLVLDPN